MTKNQRKGFWALFIGFCITGTFALYVQGAFDRLGLGSSLIMVFVYLVVGFFMHVWVKRNAAEVETWFQ